MKVFPDTDWKTTLTAQKCPTIEDSADDVELMPAIQALPVTEIGIRMPSIGRGNFQNIYQYKICIIILLLYFIIKLYGFQVIFQ